MTTLAVMKARIADELMRGDLTSPIATAVSDAIKHYQRKRLYLNESDSLTFSTVNGQSEYAAAANSLIPYLYKIDWVTGSSSPRFLDRIDNETYRDLTQTSASGQPYCYTYFDQVIRLYPTPTAVETIRIQAHYKLAEPASDAEADNLWMTDAEELIRHRAKMLIWRDVVLDVEKAAVCAASEKDAFDALAAMSNAMTGTGRLVPTSF